MYEQYMKQIWKRRRGQRVWDKGRGGEIKGEWNSARKLAWRSLAQNVNKAQCTEKWAKVQTNCSDRRPFKLS